MAGECGETFDSKRCRGISNNQMGAITFMFSEGKLGAVSYSLLTLSV